MPKNTAELVRGLAQFSSLARLGPVSRVEVDNHDDLVCQVQGRLEDYDALLAAFAELHDPYEDGEPADTLRRLLEGRRVWRDDEKARLEGFRKMWAEMQTDQRSAALVFRRAMESALRE